MARASYTPLPLSRAPSFDSAEDEMERAFTPDDEDDEETTHLTLAERPIMEPIYTNQGAPAYDFERDYDIPPPGSPPATYSSSHPAAGNSNGIIPSPSSTVRLEPASRSSRMSFFRRTVGAILPQYYTRLPTSDAESRRVHGSGVENDGVFANVLAKPARPATTDTDENGDIYVVPEETQKDAPPVSLSISENYSDFMLMILIAIVICSCAGGHCPSILGDNSSCSRKWHRWASH